MARTNLKSSLVRYARTSDGWRRGSLVFAKNGRFKPAAMMVNGQPIEIDPNSVFQIRYYDGPTAKYQTVGTDYEAAQKTLERYQHSRQLEVSESALGIRKPDEAEEEVKTLAEQQVICSTLGMSIAELFKGL